MIKFWLFARWSGVDMHYELVDSYDTLEKAEKGAETVIKQGAIAFRIETREVVDAKGGKDAK